VRFREHGGYRGVGGDVRGEIADAIRLAFAAASTVWISIALERVEDSLLEQEYTARGLRRSALNDLPVGVPRPATTAEGVYKQVVGHLTHFRFSLPPHVKLATIRWMMAHLAIGTSRGGGRSGKLSAERMRAVLADPRKLARVMKSRQE
jgi:hypothetical protein